MSAQIAGVDVRLWAAAALVGPLVVVHMFVQLEIVRPGEPLLTNVASKLLSGVDSNMPLQGDVLHETLATNLAFKRSFARVNTKMCLEVPIFGEPPLADAAPVRLLSCVDIAHMPHKVAFLRETFAANLAREQPFARMNTNMGLDIAQLAARLLT